MLPPPASPGSRHPLEVMVIEDETRLRDLLQQVLQGWGFTVTTARSGEEAILLLEKGLPDVAIIDLNLPGMSGLELLRLMRERAQFIQAIILTGRPTVESAQQAIHLQIVEYLTKPCRLGELEQAIDRAMRRIFAIPGNGILSVPRPADGRTLLEVEQTFILGVLAKNDGNRTKTANELGISRRCLYYKLEACQKQGLEAIKPLGRHESSGDNGAGGG